MVLNIKNLSAILLFVFTFSFIHSEILVQLEGDLECNVLYDYCKLVQNTLIKASLNENVTIKNNIQFDSINPYVLASFEISYAIYHKHQNFSFYHLELPSRYLVNQSFLI